MKTLKEHISDQIDREIARVIQAMVDKVQLLLTSRSTQFQMALAELDEHAAVLEEAGEKLKPNDPYLIAVLEQWETLMGMSAILLTVEAETIAEAGAALAEPVFRASLLSSLAATNPEAQQLYAESLPEEEKARNPFTPAVQLAIGAALLALGYRLAFPSDAAHPNITPLTIAQKYTGSEEWRLKMANLAPGYREKFTQIILKGIASGWSPLKVASQLRRTGTTLPVYVIEGIARTLLLTAYREATSVIEKMNSEYLLYKLRIATLDKNTCLACIALHGTRLEIGERVDDHYRGRCDEFLVVKDGALHPPMMQADSVPGKRNFVPWMTGEEWLASMPLERLRQQASFAGTPAKMNAYLEGVPIEAFLGSYSDPVFGNMVVEQSLKGALGEEQASKYYVRNYGKPPDL
jgi:hypothetical protein